MHNELSVKIVTDFIARAETAPQTLAF